MSNITIMQKTMVLWENAHYTQNDNHALYAGAFMEEGDDSRTVDFVGKVEYPWSEAKNKHVPKLVVLKSGIKLLFESVAFQSTVYDRGSQYLPCQLH